MSINLSGSSELASQLWAVAGSQLRSPASTQRASSEENTHRVVDLSGRKLCLLLRSSRGAWAPFTDSKSPPGNQKSDLHFWFQLHGVLKSRRFFYLCEQNNLFLLRSREMFQQKSVLDSAAKPHLTWCVASRLRICGPSKQKLKALSINQ